MPDASFQSGRVTIRPSVVGMTTSHVEPEISLAPVAHVPNGQPVHADAHDPPVVGLPSAVFREELQLPDVAFLVEGLDGMLPLLALRVVQLAEIERLALEDAATDAHVLHHAPVVVDLAVLESLCSPYEHSAYYRMVST